MGLDFRYVKKKFLYCCETCCEFTQSEPNICLNEQVSRKVIEGNYKTAQTNLVKTIDEKIQIVNSRNNQKIAPLLSLTLKPPPIAILRKWWLLLKVPSRPTEKLLSANEKTAATS